MARKAGVTLREVAARSNCSITAASKVLNNARGNIGVGAETRANLLKVARQLSYRPNYHARTLKAGRSFSLGMLLDLPSTDEASQNWLRRMAEGVELEARERGYDYVSIGPSSQDNALERGLQHAVDGRVDALVIPGSKPSLIGTDSKQVRVPAVLLADDRHHTGLPVVELDAAPGIHEAVRHLAELGHRRVLWLGLQGKEGEVAPERYRACKEEAEACGLRIEADALSSPVTPKSPDIVQTIEHCRRCVTQKIDRLRAFTAILCYNDLMALGVSAALMRAGVRVPEDVSLIGFDDQYAQFAYPPLTTISHRLREMGRRATALALRMLDDGREFSHWQGHRERIPARLAVRASTGRAPKP